MPDSKRTITRGRSAINTAKNVTKRGNKHHMLFRYTMVALGFVLFALIIGGKLFYTTVVEASSWNEHAKREMSKYKVINPERGNILASNGNILACDLVVYDVKVDLRHPKLLRYNITDDSIKSLADSLDKYYPRNPTKTLDCTNPDTLLKYSWNTVLTNEIVQKPFGKRKRALVLVKKGSMADYDRIRTFPILRGIGGKGGRHPLYTQKKVVRQRPFGSMAGRSIGRVNEDRTRNGEIHGYSGLEKDLDSLLYGKPGQSKLMAMTGGMRQWITTPPVRGYDIVTTIDIDIQDVLEEELLKVCEENNAEWGTAVLMEVNTGEIKAISNVERLDNGTYGEALNRAVMGFEPGSVMKPISLMIAFEDGVVKNVTDVVDCSPFQKTQDPHAPSTKNMRQVIALSSNTGIARVIFRKYSSNPELFYDRLASIGFFEPMHTGIAGEQIPQIRRLTDKDSRGNNITMTARHLDLARQAYGYNTMIPPLFTLSYYNAIANGGEYIRPHLVKYLRREGMPDSVMPVHKQRICSERTAEMVRQCLYDVVWADHCTARAVKDERVKIAGKTGTAFPVEDKVYNKSKRRFAFAGFFPYDKPKYSCIAVILMPGGSSAARTSGQVLKNVALKLYARSMLGQDVSYTDDIVRSNPVLYGSRLISLNSVHNDLQLQQHSVLKTSREMAAGKMPDVVGYDVGTALKILELSGLHVNISGHGYVHRQSIPSGASIKPGQRVILYLTDK